MQIDMNQITLSSLYVKPYGRLDIDAAAEFGMKVKDYVEDKNITFITLDFSEVTFISSFGLKVILEIYQIMNDPGKIVVTNATEQIKNAFVMVGFDKFISIE